MLFLGKKSYKQDQFLDKKLEPDTVFLGSTDTILGLMGPLTLAVKEKLDLIKGRQEKPYLIIIGSYDQLDLFITKTEKDRLLPFLPKIWPGPFTCILHARADAPSHLLGIGHTIALRMPHHNFLQQLALANNGIFSTSANLSGQPAPQTVEQVAKLIIEKVDFIILDNTLQTVAQVTPSTIIDCTTTPFTLVRASNMTQEDFQLLLLKK
jgi:L-threonylcarbamoyladenylate synthase